MAAGVTVDLFEASTTLPPSAVALNHAEEVPRHGVYGVASRPRLIESKVPSADFLLDALEAAVEKDEKKRRR